jgi:hypothetical protein
MKDKPDENESEAKKILSGVTLTELSQKVKEAYNECKVKKSQEKVKEYVRSSAPKTFLPLVLFKQPSNK